MKTTVRALSLCLLAGLAGYASAGTIAIEPATASGQTTGGPTVPATIAVTYTQAQAGETTNNLTARVIYNTAVFTVAITDGTASCADNAGEITVLSNNFTAGLLASGTLCTLTFTSIAGSAAGAYPLDLVTDLANEEGCATNVPAPTNPACTLVDGQITLSAGTFNYAATPASLSFNGVVGAPTATQNVTIAAQAGNTGPVTFSACTFGGANPGDYSLSPSPAFPLNVAAGGSVNLPIAFTAGALGARNATFSCTTANGTAVGGSFPITLNGTGVTNTLTTTPATLNFPGTLQGSTSAPLNVTAAAGAGNTGNVTITSCAISGANAGDFAQTPAIANVTVAPGASANVPVTFTPGGVGSRTATLTCNLTNGPAATFTTTLNGEGVEAEAILGANPATGTAITSLGNAGTPIIRLVAFSNTGNAPGTVTCTVAGAGFTVGNSPLTLAPGANGTVSVTGTSLAPATLTGTLTCNGSEGSTFTYPLNFTFGSPVVTQIPALNGFGLFALLGLFAGVGVFFGFRNRA